MSLYSLLLLSFSPVPPSVGFHIMLTTRVSSKRSPCSVGRTGLLIFDYSCWRVPKSDRRLHLVDICPLRRRPIYLRYVGLIYLYCTVHQGNKYEANVVVFPWALKGDILAIGAVLTFEVSAAWSPSISMWLTPTSSPSRKSSCRISVCSAREGISAALPPSHCLEIWLPSLF